MSTTENWRHVVGYEGYYEVSDHGRVRSVDRVIDHPKGPTRRRGQMMTPASNGWYMMVPLHYSGKLFNGKVHRLVLEAFIGPCPPGMVCCHNDGDHTNNHVTNLRWDTQRNNNRDTVRHGKHHQASAKHCKHGHPFSEANTYIKPEGQRACRTCLRTRSREHQRKVRA